MSAGLYLLHFEPRYKHAGHYLGYSSNWPARVIEHLERGPKASPLVRAALEAGCAVSVSRVYEGGSRKRERSIKRAGGLGRSCPVCRAAGYRR